VGVENEKQYDKATAASALEDLVEAVQALTLTERDQGKDQWPEKSHEEQITIRVTRSKRTALKCGLPPTFKGKGGRI